jgi:hypothetical protein
LPFGSILFSLLHLSIMPWSFTPGAYDMAIRSFSHSGFPVQSPLACERKKIPLFSLFPNDTNVYAI